MHSGKGFTFFFLNNFNFLHLWNFFFHVLDHALLMEGLKKKFFYFCELNKFDRGELKAREKFSGFVIISGHVRSKDKKKLVRLNIILKTGKN